jgi:hypothetical protein
MSKGQSEMTDHAAFIAVICDRTAQGLDTTAERLIFEDWLEEHAGSVACPNYSKELIHPKSCRLCHGSGSVSNGYAERAEFIRCQVELSTSHKQDWCGCILDPESRQAKIRCKPCLLRRRESEILSTNVSRWINGPHNPLLGMRPDQIEWRGGFPAKVRCSFSEWCGEECPRDCRNGWLTFDSYRPAQCPHCHGLGRINALGPAIVAAAPIEEFEATDGQPPNPSSLPFQVAIAEGRAENNRRALQWARKKWLDQLKKEKTSD